MVSLHLVLISFNSLLIRTCTMTFLFGSTLIGKTDYAGELTEKEIIRAERNSGVISNRVREIQVSIS